MADDEDGPLQQDGAEEDNLPDLFGDDEEVSPASGVAPVAQAAPKAKRVPKTRVGVAISEKEGRGTQAGKKGRPAKGGERVCPSCFKKKQSHEIGAGSKFCLDDCKTSVQNIGNSARAQGQWDWWEKVMSDPLKLRKTIAHYALRHPKVRGQKRPKCVVMVFIENLILEESYIRDSIKQMMRFKQFSAWMAKPENGSLDSEESKELFKSLFKQAGAVIDDQGIPKFKERVGVHIQDLVITRNARTRQQMISMSGKQEKNPNEDAMEQARSKMDDKPEWSKSGENFLSGDTSHRLNAAVVQGSGLASSGTSAVAIEDVKRFALEVEDEMQVKADQGKGGSASVAPADPSGRSHQLCWRRAVARQVHCQRGRLIGGTT